MAKQIYGNRNCPLPVEVISDCDNPVFVSQCGYDFEKRILCDKTNGDKVLLIVQIDQETFLPTVSYYDLITGFLWAWDPQTDLEACPDSDTESDGQIFCDAWNQFIRWFTKLNGEPTGTVFDTSLNWTPYVASGSELPWTCWDCLLNGSVWTISSRSDIN